MKHYRIFCLICDMVEDVLKAGIVILLVIIFVLLFDLTIDYLCR